MTDLELEECQTEEGEDETKCKCCVEYEYCRNICPGYCSDCDYIEKCEHPSKYESECE